MAVTLFDPKRSGGDGTGEEREETEVAIFVVWGRHWLQSNVTRIVTLDRHSHGQDDKEATTNDNSVWT